MQNNTEYYDRELKKINKRLLHSERWILIMVLMALIASVVLLFEIRSMEETKKSQAGTRDFVTMEMVYNA